MYIMHYMSLTYSIAFLLCWGLAIVAFCWFSRAWVRELSQSETISRESANKVARWLLLVVCLSSSCLSLKQTSLMSTGFELLFDLYKPWLLILLVPLLCVSYIWLNDAKLTRLPPEAASLSPHRWTDEEIRDCYAGLMDGSKSLLEGKLPPKTDRRYIVVGGAGFLGGWIVLHLLQRGENPRRIRVLDIRSPVREDLQADKVGEVDFVQVNIADRQKVEEAFRKPWPDDDDDDDVAESSAKPELTVFHTAATIRFFERHPDLLYLSEDVNVHGTQNVLDAARLVGARSFVYTSSGSVGVRRTRFWLFPWEKEPDFYTQVINDETSSPSRQDLFFSNYAVSKLAAEARVRAADKSRSGDGTMRTGCIRPGNGIFGPGGDLLAEAYLVKKYNPTWLRNIVQSFCFVENCSLAHLLYEERLIDIERGMSNPDIGGQTFCVADSGPPPTYGDTQRALNILSNGETTFPHFSPTTMLGVAQLVELYYLTRRFLLNSRYACVARPMPPVVGEIVFLQPSMFALTNVHLIFDDSRAREPPEKGGLGYKGQCSTLVGMCQVVVNYYRTGGQVTARAIAGHKETQQSPVVGAEQAVGGVVGKLGNGMDVVNALN
ncbi:hypothetical protein BC835DRAFT_988614 [Cytidiella melzeri]|nr:hypothetical protein BC835DRAFT_988614 [Cytidiella melzeri]